MGWQNMVAYFWSPLKEISNNNYKSVLFDMVYKNNVAYFWNPLKVISNPNLNSVVLNNLNYPKLGYLHTI